jgi:hypothetical protein
MTTSQLAADLDRLIERVARWSAGSWRLPATGAPGSRAEVAHGLVQRLADLEAAMTSRAAHPVPRLDSDLAIPDQLRVIARDLIAADPDPASVAAATEAVRAARAALV